MTISFNSIPTNLRIPFVAVEVDASNAQQGPGLLPYRAILLGQKTSAGTATANTIHPVSSPDDVIALAGARSMLRRMAMAWFASNQSTPLSIGVLADPSGASAAGTITVTGPATADGTVNLYIGGEYIPVAVTSGDANTAIATNIGAAITANLDLPVTASVSSGVVTVTFAHVGSVGNGLDIRVNYQDGQATPAGVGVACVSLSGGTGAPSLTSMIAALGDSWFQIWAHPYTDATSLTAIEAELASRFGPMRMIDGLAITAASGSLGTLAALGEGRNSGHSCIGAQPGVSPLTPPFEYAAERAAIIAFYGQQDPARPFQTLPFTWTLPIPEANRFTNQERDNLLHDGIATSRVAAGGVVQIEREITTYQTNGSGAPDTAYLDATTLLTIMYLRYSFRNLMLTKYPRHKLAADGTRVGPGQAVITPKIGKAEAIAWFSDMIDLGLVQNLDLFKANLIVEINGSDPNRLDFLLPPTLMNQLIVTAAQIGFRL